MWHGTYGTCHLVTKLVDTAVLLERRCILLVACCPRCLFTSTANAPLWRSELRKNTAGISTTVRYALFRSLCCHSDDAARFYTADPGDDGQRAEGDSAAEGAAPGAFHITATPTRVQHLTPPGSRSLSQGSARRRNVLALSSESVCFPRGPHHRTGN